jgi:hypothetical protein
MAPAPWARAASCSDDCTWDTGPTRTRALVGRLAATYAMSSYVVVWYRLMPILDKNGRLYAKM